jgi:hypothetical protein
MKINCMKIRVGEKILNIEIYVTWRDKKSQWKYLSIHKKKLNVYVN